MACLVGTLRLACYLADVILNATLSKLLPERSPGSPELQLRLFLILL